MWLPGNEIARAIDLSHAQGSYLGLMYGQLGRCVPEALLSTNLKAAVKTTKYKPGREGLREKRLAHKTLVDICSSICYPTMQ